jgi:hypothetical protein
MLEQSFRGGDAGHAGDDPLAALLPVGNQGGFRYAGSPTQGTVKLVVLYTSGGNPDWPDTLDGTTGTFRYYGDNRAPGNEMHDTPRRGNEILRKSFADAHSGESGRRAVPPFLLFERDASGGRAVRFRGLLVPGAEGVLPDEQLVAIWRSRDGARFQNYRAIFTVLDVPVVHRNWLNNVLQGDNSSGAPPEWRQWVESGSIVALHAPPTTIYRSKAAQLPASGNDQAMLETLHAYFNGHPYAFEHCAAELFKLTSPGDVEIVEITRQSRDGGRDAIGLYALGPSSDRVKIDFALEAKCYGPNNAIGVREMARLISRLRHRQFGVLVTTSYVQRQAYEEVRGDGHPIVILAGRDLVEIIKVAGPTTPTTLRRWLDTRFAHLLE